MRSIFFILLLLKSAHADDFFGCTFTVNRNNRVMHSEHLSVNQSHQLWNWRSYRFALKYQENQSIEWEMDPINGLRTWVKQMLIPDQKLFRLLIDESGYMFQVSCIYLEES